MKIRCHWIKAAATSFRKFRAFGASFQKLFWINCRTLKNGKFEVHACCDRVLDHGDHASSGSARETKPKQKFYIDVCAPMNAGRRTVREMHTEAPSVRVTRNRRF